MTRFEPCNGNYRGVSFRRINVLAAVLAVLAVLNSPVSLFAQLPKLPKPASPKPVPIAPTDLLGRESPRGTMMGLLRAAERQDYQTAARYLQTVPGQDLSSELTAKDFRALHTHFKGDLALLTDDPQGAVEPGLAPGQVRAGAIKVDGTTVDVILVRVDDPDEGKIWLVSKETAASIPALYAELESEPPTLFDRIIPGALRNREVLGLSLAQWIAWLLSIPLSWLLASLLTVLLSVPAWIRCRLKKLPFTSIWKTRVGRPIECIIAILIHGFFVYQLNPPLLYRVYYFRFLTALLVGCLLWVVSALADRGFEHFVRRTRTEGKGGEAIVILVQRLNRVLLLTIALIAALVIFGVNVKATLAGLGIGGLAIALAAQKSLENLIGGVSLLMDKAIRVGDFCKIGDQIGTVEDIGLRSLKLRTLDQNVSVVPNGSLAQMQFQNMARRSKLLLSQTFSLRIETRSDQLRVVLDRIESLLNQHPSVEGKTCRVRVASFSGAAFQLELFAFIKTGDMAEFTLIRQELILKIAEIVETCGSGFAGATQLAYVSVDKGLETEKAADSAHPLSEAKARDLLSFPAETRTGTDR